MNSLRVLIVAATFVFTGACADALGPQPDQLDEIADGQVRVTLHVAPDVLDPPGTVVATLTYENLGSDVVRLVSSYGCVSFASVYLGGDRIPFPATQYACTAAFSSRDLVPGAPLTVQWPLVIGGENGMHVPAGTYRFVAELNTHAEDLERTFVVR